MGAAVDEIFVWDTYEKEIWFSFATDGPVAVEMSQAACDELCTGSSELTVTAPQCYSGRTPHHDEHLTVVIHDFASSKGHLDLLGHGEYDITCAKRAFVTDGQTMIADLSDCMPSSVDASSMRYCSDQ